MTEIIEVVCLRANDRCHNTHAYDKCIMYKDLTLFYNENCSSSLVCIGEHEYPLQGTSFLRNYEPAHRLHDVLKRLLGTDQAIDLDVAIMQLILSA